MYRVGAMLCLIAPVLLIAPRLQAQEMDEVTKAAFLEHLRSAEVFYTEGDFVRAARSLENALALREDARILRRLGEVYERAEDLDNALTYYQRYLATLSSNEIERRRYEAIVQDLEQRPARLQIESKPPTGVLIEISERGTNKLVKRVSTPVETLSLPRGEYQVRASRDGYSTLSTPLKLARGQRAVLALELVEDPVPTTTKILGATGIAALAVGLGFVGYGANQYYGAAPSGNNGLSRAAANERKTNGKRNMAIGGITAGAGALLGGIGLLYWNLSDDEPVSAQIQAGPGDIGVSVELRF